MYTKKYNANYCEVIKELFEIGDAESSNTSGPGIISEELQNRFPNKFNLPMQLEIQSEIQKLIQNKRSKSKPKQQEQDLYQAYNEKMVDNNPTLKPKVGLQTF